MKRGAAAGAPLSLPIAAFRRARSGRFVGRGPDPRRHRLVEPLLVDRFVFPGFDDFLQPFVECFAEFVVALFDDESILFFRFDPARDFEFRSASTAFSATGRSITTASIVPASRAGIVSGPWGKGRSSLVLISSSTYSSPVVPCWTPTILPSRSLRRTQPGRALLDHDRLRRGQVVGVGEVDRFLAFVGDRRRRGDHFELALGEVAEDRVERGVLEFGLRGRSSSPIASTSSTSKPLNSVLVLPNSSNGG